jgi:hypothetical protein
MNQLNFVIYIRRVSKVLKPEVSKCLITVLWLLLLEDQISGDILVQHFAIFIKLVRD